MLLSCLCFGACMNFPPVEGPVTREMSTRGGEERPAATVPVVLFADNLHTGLILDLRWLRLHGYVPPAGVRDKRWAAFSWGDQAAYVQREWLSPAQVFQAFATPTPSVMEIIAFDWNIPEVCHHQRLYQGFTTDEAGAGLAAFLNHCSMRDASGEPLVLGPASWGEGLMIRSPHSYYFPRICNVWTVEALNASGFRFSRTLGLSADGVLRQAGSRGNGFAKIWDPEWQMAAGPGR